MNYEQELQALRDAQLKMTTDELQKQKEIGMTQLTQQEAQIKPKYALQRQQASAGSQLGAKNFAEFLANRGLTSSGTAVEGELTRTNQLNQNLGTIQTAENEAMQNIQNQRTNLEMQSGAELARQQGAINLDYMKNVFDYKSQLAKEARDAAKSQSKPNYFKGISLSQFGFQNATGIKGTALDKNTIRYQVGPNDFVDLPRGTNPYTGTANKTTKEVYDPNTGKTKTVSTVFANGYQPNEIGGVKLKPSGVKTTVNGQEQNVWAKGTGDNATLWYWDVTQNKYLPYTG